MRSPVQHPHLALAVLCAGMFLVLLDVTAVNVALPSIGADLAASVASLQWVVDAYAVLIASFLLLAGTLGDRVGHRRVLLLGFAVFGLASLICGSAPGTAVLVAGRAVQGFGAALLLPGTLALIASGFPEPNARARAIGTWAAASSLALPAGPLLGGLLVTHGSWRWVFWLNVPVVVLVLLALPRVVPPDPASAPAADLDWGGGLALAGTIAAAVTAVIEAGRSAPPPAVATAAFFAVVALAAGWRTERRAAHPLLPAPIVTRRQFSGPNLVALTMNLVTNGVLFVTTLYLQQLRGDSPLRAGVLVLPMATPLVALAPVAGRWAGSRGPAHPMTAGALIGACGGALLAVAATGGRLERSGGLLVLELALLLLGAGAGLVTASSVSAAVAAAPADAAGLASGVNNTARQTGTALGIAIYGAVAGSPHDGHPRFLAGFAILGVLTAAAWSAAAGLTLCTVRPPARDPGQLGALANPRSAS